MSRTPGNLKARGSAGYTGHGANDVTGRSVFSVPSNGNRPREERNANVEFAVHAWNNHDALVNALSAAVIEMKANGASAEQLSKFTRVLVDAMAPQ